VQVPGQAPVSAALSPVLPAAAWPAPVQAAPAAPVAAWPPAVLPYRADMPIPPGYRLESRVNRGLVYGGLAVFAVPYVSGLIAAAASGFSKKSGWLALPIVGPFMAMGGRDLNECDFINVSSTPSSGGLNPAEEQAQCRKLIVREARMLGVLAMDGLLQAAGSVMTVAGLFSPHELLLRNDLFPPNTKLSFDAGYYNGQVRLHARLEF
jgi:hypothetical protein